MSFEDYLLGKKIDAAAFKSGELPLWQSWQIEFDQMHPQSFTSQKLYLINPIRLKYPLKVEKGTAPVSKPENPVTEKPSPNAAESVVKPVVAKPKFATPKPNSQAEQGPKEIKKPAKPVMVKPVLAKPKINPSTLSAEGSAGEESKPLAKPIMAKPVMAKPKVVIPKSIKAEEHPKENSDIPKEASANTQQESAPEKKPMPRPVFKPKIKPQ